MAGFRVVCISRAFAAGGEAVGEAVAQELGFRYIDELIIARAAQQARVDPVLVAAAEQRQPLLRRLLAALPNARDLAAAVTLAPSAGHGHADSYRAEADEMRTMIRAAIHEVARAGEAVIVAHAASMALAGAESVLRVLVTASPAVRAQRLAAAEGLGTAEAKAAIASSDRERREYFKRFYGVHEEHPTHYDLTVCTDGLSPAGAAAIILAAARGR